MLNLGILEKQKRTDLPEINPGMLVRVWERIDIKNPEKISPFEGIVISVRNRNSINKTFTVRGNISNYYVEKTYFYHSPAVYKIEIIAIGKTRRANLYFIRDISESKLRKKLKFKSTTSK
jgi:large subunit ribosomal protein L19